MVDATTNVIIGEETGTINMKTTSTPVTPDAGNVKVFVDSADDVAKQVDSTGTVSSLVTAPASGVTATTQAGTPGSAPGTIGDVNVDTTNERYFGGIDTGAAADFKRLDSAIVYLKSGSLGAPAASFSISGWPTDNNGYEYLLMRINQNSTDRAAQIVDGFVITFNSDTGTNYFTNRYVGSVASFTYSELLANAGFLFTQCAKGALGDTGRFGTFSMMIYDPGSTSIFRNVMAEGFISAGTAGEGRKLAYSGAWENNTDAITSITFTPQHGPNFLAGLTWDLYGVYNV